MVLVGVNHSRPLLIGGDAGGADKGDGLLRLVVILGIHYDSVEGDRIEAGGIAVDRRIIGLGGIIDTGMAIGLVADLKEIGIGEAGLPLSIDAGHLSGGTLYGNHLARTIDRLEGVVDTEVQVGTNLVRQIDDIVVVISITCIGGCAGTTAEEDITCGFLTLFSDGVVQTTPVDNSAL